jgi:hypothetical protein
MHTHTNMHARTHALTHTYTHAHTYTHTHTHARTHTHTHTHTHTRLAFANECNCINRSNPMAQFRSVWICTQKQIQIHTNNKSSTLRLASTHTWTKVSKCSHSTGSFGKSFEASTRPFFKKKCGLGPFVVCLCVCVCVCVCVCKICEYLHKFEHTRRGSALEVSVIILKHSQSHAHNLSVSVCLLHEMCHSHTHKHTFLFDHSSDARLTRGPLFIRLRMGVILQVYQYLLEILHNANTK